MRQISYVLKTRVLIDGPWLLGLDRDGLLEFAARTETMASAIEVCA